MLAVIAGLGTFIGLNAVLTVGYGIACGISQLLNALLRFSYVGWVIKCVAWFGCAWAGMSVWEAVA